MKRLQLTKIVLGAMLAALAVSADVAWAQFVPPSRSGMYYGWGPYVSDAVVPRSTRAAQEGADRRQQLQQNFAQHQAMNQQLLSTAQQRTAQIKQQRQTTDQLRMNLAQQHADRLASASQGAYMPPAGVPGLPAGPTVPGPKSEAGDDGSEPPATSAIPTSGEMRWPTVLREPQFDKPRSELEKLLRAAHQSQAGLTSAEYEDIVKAAEKMREILRSMVHDLSAAEYLWVDEYLQNLAKQATQLAHP